MNLRTDLKRELNIIIIDDEIRSVENLQILLDQLDFKINCLGFAHNVMDGIKLIKAVRPELVFLDINMPQHNGFDLLEAIETKDFTIVFTTAHEEYAIQSIRNRAFDYLLKPIDQEELNNCILRFMAEFQPENPTDSKKPLKIALKDGFLFLKQEEIIRIEANGSYSDIHTVSGKKHTISKNLKSVSEQLNPGLFYRCHNSHIINLSKVRKFNTSDGFFVEMEDQSVAEVSRNKKDELLGRF